MTNQATSNQKRFSVKIEPKDKELIDVMWGLGFLDLSLSYEVNDLTDSKELSDTLLARYDSQEEVDMVELDVLLDLISMGGVIAEASNDEGYFYCDNEFWELRVIKSSHTFSAEDLADIYQESQYALMGCGIVVDGVNIDDVPIDSYRKILGVLSWDDWDAAMISRMLRRYKTDKESRDKDRADAVKTIITQVKSGELSDWIEQDAYLDLGVCESGANLIFIDDPLRVLALPDSYQISQPSIALGGKTSIYKQDNAFQVFDSIDNDSIKDIGNFIIFTGSFMVGFELDGAVIESKRVFAIKNTEQYKSHLQAYKSEKHTGELADLRASPSFSKFDDLVCTYCGTVNEVVPDEHSFVCQNCKKRN